MEGLLFLEKQYHGHFNSCKIPRKIVSGNNIYVQFFMKINNLLNEALSFCHEIERAHPITDSSFNNLFQNLEEKQRAD